MTLLPRPLLARASLRYLLGHPWQLGLALLGVALGVAVVVAVDLANQSASRGFSLSAEALTGRATHQVVAGPEGLPEEWYVRLRTEAGIRPSAPVVEGFVRLPGHGDRTLRILGVDVFAEAGVRPALGAVSATVEPADLLARPRGAVLLASDLERLGRAVGDTLTVRHGGRDHALRIVAGLRPERELEAVGLRDVAIMDIAAAQELLGRVGRLDRVDLVADAATADRVADRIPDGARLVVADRRAETLEQMTDAFRLNLQAFSLLALVVGAFLIYNTMTFSVVQRRRLMGLLRATGTTRGELLGVVLGEAVVIGVLGTAAGVALGVALATVLVDLVTRTINDLYFVLAVRELTLTPGSLLRGAALGIGMTVVAALAPAREATTVPPRAALSRSVLERAHRRWLPGLVLAGVALLAAGGLLLVASERSLVVPFAGLFGVILGGALLVPPGLWLVTRGLAPVLGAAAGFTGRMTARGVAASLSRTGVAASALAVAVSAVIGVGVMVDSFRTTFAEWLDATLHADVYVSVAGGGPMDAEQRRRLLAVSGVATATRSRFVRVGAGDHEARLRVFAVPPAAEDGFSFRTGNPETAWRAYRQDGAVFVTEPYAWHQELEVGDRVTLNTGSGTATFPVAAVVYDYGTSEGAIIMARRTYTRYWDDNAVDSLGIRAADGVDPERLQERLRQAAAAGGQQLAFRADHEIRARSLAVFDRTFTITEVLRLLAILVAVTGVLSALLALALERAREYAVLRAGGMTARELGGLVTAQNALVGLLSGLFAVPLGLALAGGLIGVINRRSFGWSMDLAVDPWILLQAVALSVAAAVAAGIYPAWRLARTEPALALREE
ncbi:ABC transporter permease [Aquisalimonas lutea]|uniref:ABC transporter permease n=1 Tax=Aquisalimonas lutea TaxID=1327750 RepID=UPI0025B5B8D0|nr:ABC transporter permease [Aquisalimonas lutea]MDN3518945.1 ABC transporter permease [Aquisalimonas lutea]